LGGSIQRSKGGEGRRQEGDKRCQKSKKVGSQERTSRRLFQMRSNRGAKRYDKQTNFICWMHGRGQLEGRDQRSSRADRTEHQKPTTTKGVKLKRKGQRHEVSTHKS